MQFEQDGPARATRDDGTVVELVDTHHAQLYGPDGTWLVEVGPKDRPDWFSLTVHAPSLLRAGGDPMLQHNRKALEEIVEGLRAMRIRVSVDGNVPAHEDEDVPAHEDEDVADDAS